MHCIITNFLQIRKDDVDNYNGGIAAVPACQLTVKPQVPDSTPAISYRFTIEGTDTKTVLFEMGKFSCACSHGAGDDILCSTDPQRDFHSNFGVGTKEVRVRSAACVWHGHTLICTTCKHSVNVYRECGCCPAVVSVACVCLYL